MKTIKGFLSRAIVAAVFTVTTLSVAAQTENGAKKFDMSKVNKDKFIQLLEQVMNGSMSFYDLQKKGYEGKVVAHITEKMDEAQKNEIITMIKKIKDIKSSPANAQQLVPCAGLNYPWIWKPVGACY